MHKHLQEVAKSVLFDFINRKYVKLILKVTILVNCTGKFCHGHGIFRNTEAATAAVLINFTKFTGKHLFQSPFLNKVASLRPANLLKKRLRHKCFTVNFVKFLRTTFLQATFSQNIKAYV